MSGILTPGYLRWDGTKYVLDADIEIVGPPGSAGPTGPVGPGGPAGPFGVASGDLSGTYPGPMAVVGLTGISGVVNFGSGITNPTIRQAATGGTNGQTMTLGSQNAALFGGNVVLQSGTGSTSGIIQFVIGNSVAAFIDSNNTFRLGPGASSTVIGPNGTSPLAGTDFIYGNNVSGSIWTELYSGAASHRAAMAVYNYSTAGVGVNGISIQAAGSTDAITQYQNNGAIEQSGTTTSGLVLGAVRGDGSGRVVTGRVWASGAWGIGDSGNNNTSAAAQAGVTGAVINIASNSGGIITPTTSANQAIIFNQYTGIDSTYGILALQGNVGVNLMSATTSVANTTITKFITSQGRTLKVINTTASPYNVLATDEIVSIGTISAVSTTTTAVQPLPMGTINVTATAGFPTSGAILVVTTNGPQVVTYMGVSGGNSFTGCTGGTGSTSIGGGVSSLFTVNLPASPATGDTYTIKDSNGSAGQNNILIIGNGHNIDTFADLLVMTNFTQTTVVYNGTQWISALTNNISPNAGYTSVVNVASGASALVVGLDELLLCDPTTAGCTVRAPAAPTTNMRFTVKDATFTASNANPVTIDGNGKTLEDPNTPGNYVSPIAFNVTNNGKGRSATWAFDPTRNRYTLVATAL